MGTMWVFFLAKDRPRWKKRWSSPVPEMLTHILTLPSYYAMMAFLSVHLWSQFFYDDLGEWTDHGRDPFPPNVTDAKERFVIHMVEVFFATADLFEITSLLFFVNLMLSVIDAGMLPESDETADRLASLVKGFK